MITELGDSLVGHVITELGDSLVGHVITELGDSLVDHVIVGVDCLNARHSTLHFGNTLVYT